MSADKRDVAEWQQLATQYEGVIAKFERVRADLLKRRNGAADSVMTIHDLLRLNDHTLKCMRQGLKIAEQEIKRLEGQH